MKKWKFRHVHYFAHSPLSSRVFCPGKAKIRNELLWNLRAFICVDRKRQRRAAYFRILHPPCCYKKLHVAPTIASSQLVQRVCNVRRSKEQMLYTTKNRLWNEEHPGWRSNEMWRNYFSIIADQEMLGFERLWELSTLEIWAVIVWIPSTLPRYQLWSLRLWTKLELWERARENGRTIHWCALKPHSSRNRECAENCTVLQGGTSFRDCFGYDRQTALAHAPYCDPRSPEMKSEASDCGEAVEQMCPFQ